MTWKEFKEKVDEKLAELGIDEDTDTCWIDVILYGSAYIDIEYDHDEKCLKIEN